MPKLGPYLRVGLITRDYPPTIGGLATYAAALATALRRNGLHVTVFVGHTDAQTLLLPLLYDLSGYDIVHVTSPAYAALVNHPRLVITAAAPTLSEWRYYGVKQRIKTLFAFPAELIALRKACLVISMSEAMREVLSRDYHVERGRLLVIRGGVDLNRFLPGRERSTLPKTLLICSRLDPRKNIPEAFVALSRLRYPALEVLVVGDGPQGPQLKSLALKLGLKITFMGAVSDSILPNLFARADIFFTTSKAEGFGLSLVQAMAAGCAVVASDIHPHRELVQPGKTGLLYSTTGELLDQLRQLLASKDLVRELGSRARAAVTTMSWEQVAKKVVEAYTRALSLDRIDSYNPMHHYHSRRSRSEPV